MEEGKDGDVIVQRNEEESGTVSTDSDTNTGANHDRAFTTNIRKKKKLMTKRENIVRILVVCGSVWFTVSQFEVVRLLFKAFMVTDVVNISSY